MYIHDPLLIHPIWIWVEKSFFSFSLQNPFLLIPLVSLVKNNINYNKRDFWQKV